MILRIKPGLALANCALAAAGAETVNTAMGEIESDAGNTASAAQVLLRVAADVGNQTAKIRSRVSAFAENINVIGA